MRRMQVEAFLNFCVRREEDMRPARAKHERVEHGVHGVGNVDEGGDTSCMQVGGADRDHGLLLPFDHHRPASLTHALPLTRVLRAVCDAVSLDVPNDPAIQSPMDYLRPRRAQRRRQSVLAHLLPWIHRQARRRRPQALTPA